jgi:hypothetical protein
MRNLKEKHKEFFTREYRNFMKYGGNLANFLIFFKFSFYLKKYLDLGCSGCPGRKPGRNPFCLRKKIRNYLQYVNQRKALKIWRIWYLIYNNYLFIKASCKDRWSTKAEQIIKKIIILKI